MDVCETAYGRVLVVDGRALNIVEEEGGGGEEAEEVENVAAEVKEVGEV